MKNSTTFTHSSLLKQYGKLIRINKPIGIYLLLWPTLSALFLAEKNWPSWQLILIFSIGAWLVRSAGCAINDFWDKNLDPHVERTKERPLANGSIKANQAIIITIIFFLSAGLLALQLNPLSWAIAIIAATLTTLYPLAKRFTQLPQLLLGITFNSGILMAFTATQNTIPIHAWLFYAANLLFTLAYDTAYAMVDYQDDLKIGIQSTATLMGKYTLHLIALLDLMAFIILLYLGINRSLNIFYFSSLLMSALLCAWLHKKANQTRKSAFSLFQNHHLLLLIIFIGIVLSTHY